jgi:ATP-dependent Lhr-like helicase
VHVPAVLGPERDESAWAEVIARQWLDRYGIVSREWWRHDRPPVSWRAIYRELKRLEMRGEANRGHFVRGLSGAQFAHPEAVDRLREVDGAEPPVIVMSASDPANPYALPLADDQRDEFARVRGRRPVLATIGGVVVLVAESHGATMRVRPDVIETDVIRAARAVAERLAVRGSRPKDVVVETINGQHAATSKHYGAFAAAGFRRTTRAIRFLVPGTGIGSPSSF